MLPKSVINSIWKNSVTPRAQLILWMANLDKLKTSDFLVEKGNIDALQVISPFYRVDVETNSHILLSCHFSWSIWMKILEWWEIVGVLQIRCGDFVLAWNGLLLNRKRVKLWNLVLGY